MLFNRFILLILFILISPLALSNSLVVKITDDLPRHLIKNIHAYLGSLPSNEIERSSFIFTANKNTENAHELFSILIELSKSGIDNLIQTYSESDQTTLLHTLRMYRTMLDKPGAFIEDNEDSVDNDKDSIDDIFIQITQLYSPVYIDLLNNIFKLAQTNPDHYDTYITGVNTLMGPINCQLNKWISDHIVF